MVNGSNCGKGTKGFFSDFSSRYLSLREWTFTAQKQYNNPYKEIKLCFNHVTQSSEESKLYDLPVSLYLYIKNLLILECGLFDLSVFLFFFILLLCDRSDTRVFCVSACIWIIPVLTPLESVSNQRLLLSHYRNPQFAVSIRVQPYIWQ